MFGKLTSGTRLASLATAGDVVESSRGAHTGVNDSEIEIRFMIFGKIFIDVQLHTLSRNRRGREIRNFDEFRTIPVEIFPVYFIQISVETYVVVSTEDVVVMTLAVFEHSARTTFINGVFGFFFLVVFFLII